MKIHRLIRFPEHDARALSDLAESFTDTEYEEIKDDIAWRLFHDLNDDGNRLQRYLEDLLESKHEADPKDPI